MNLYLVLVGIPGSSLDAHLVENFLYGYSGVVSYCDILICPSLGTLIIPKIFFCLFIGHNPESNPFRIGPGHNLLAVCHYSDNRVLIDIDHLLETSPRLVVAHPRAQYVGPVLLANLIDCTHTTPWCVTRSDTTCIVSALYIPLWSGKG